MCLKTYRNHQKFIVLFQVLKHELNPRKELGNENTRLFFKQLKEKSILENIEIFHTLMTLTKLPFGLNYYTGTIHGDSAIDGFQYCMGLQRALQSLI